MAVQFFNSTSTDIGTSEVAVYTVPSARKSIAIGCTVANKTKGNVPVTIKVIRTDNSSVIIASDARIDGGQSIDFLSGKKLVLESGEILSVSSKLANSMDCIVSVLEGVS